MPRIVPLQLLKCLKVLLDDHGGILSANEVKRIAGLMTKYSKKLVSKCIYVLILKATKTELLGEFMAVGGWSLVYTWLNDAIRAMNWPLVQEILELLLLCPVSVHRLKVNSAPKLVKGLCRDGGNEGVRILAKRLVEQWLKIVTENQESAIQHEASTIRADVATAKTAAAPAPPATVPTANSQQQTNSHADTPKSANPPQTQTQPKSPMTNGVMEVEQDPLADSDEVSPSPTAYVPTTAQKKANETGLVYKIVVKNGQQVLAKVSKTKPEQFIREELYRDDDEADMVDEEEERENLTEADEEERDDEAAAAETIVDEEEEDTRTSSQKPEKESESSADEETTVTSEQSKAVSLEKKVASEAKLSTETDKEKIEKKERKSSTDIKERSSSDKDKDRKSSSSHRSSSSSHKSSSKSSSSSSSKSKSSSHRSSSDKHRSDKDKDRISSSSSSSKDKERREGGSSSSSSNKYKSSTKTYSSSSSSSSKDRHRDKEREKDKSNSSSSSLTSSSKKEKEREKEAQAERDNAVIKTLQAPLSIDKLGRIPKKPKEDPETDSNKPTSITIPSKKASMSIEIRRDTEKAKTVKTYKSQFRSHGLTEEAPPPPSRKDLKKPSSVSTIATGGIPTTFTPSLKRPSPPPTPRDSPLEKKPKIDLNNVKVANEKPGSIKLIPAKKIQTLVETNIFSEALAAAMVPKKLVKRKRSATSTSKDGASSPSSPEVAKVAPLKFYQDTLDESKSEEKLQDKDKESVSDTNNENSPEIVDLDKEANTEDDDDIPLKRVKEDIEKKVLEEQKSDAATTEISNDSEEQQKEAKKVEEPEVEEVKKPGPGCGPDGPPGVLMLHRRKGPKKKLTWRPQEQLEQIRFFEVDETERMNVLRNSFTDMKNMERFSERDAINMSRRGFNHEDNMQPQTHWRPLIEVDDVHPHPEGSQSKQRKVQSDREQSTLRALYFSHSMIPDSPAEAEIEPHFSHDIPIIPLDDITGNPDAVNDFTSMPWPEAKGSPKHGDNALAGTGGLNGLGSPIDMFNGVASGGPVNPFNPFVSPFNNNGSGGPANMPPHLQQQQMPMQMSPTGPQGAWQGPPPNGVVPMAGPPMMGYNSKPNMDMGPGGPPQNFMAPPGHFPNGGPQFMGGGPQFGPNGFNGPNFGPMGPGGPMGHGPTPLMNGIVGNPVMNGPVNRGNNRNNGSWRGGGGGGGNNYQDNAGGGGNGGGLNNWRPVSGGGSNRGGGGGGNNNGICKSFMRGHCRLGKACKFIHPKSKRI